MQRLFLSRNIETQRPRRDAGELRCVGATTNNEYQKHIEKDSAFERRLQKVMVHR
jgi:ATP-dependent Clp protease ATP-binding subunit ClpA